MIAGFGAKIYDIVGFCDQIEVMLNDNDSSTFIDEAVQDLDKPGHVVRVQADGGFFKDVKGSFSSAGGLDFLRRGSRTPRELRDELDALGFTAAQGWAGLAHLQVSETRFHEKIERPANFRMWREEFGGLLGGHFHDITDGFAIVSDFQRRGVVTLSAAFLTRDVQTGEGSSFRA